jgi:WD40 repeat protein
MRRLLLPLVCLAILTASTAAQSPADLLQPQLVLDPGGHTASVLQVAFTPDAQRVVSISRDKSVRVWDVTTGETLRIFRFALGPGREGAVRAMALSPDGRLLAVSTYPVAQGKFGNPIFLLELQNGRVVKVLKEHRKVVTALTFSADGQRLASGSGDQDVLVWDAKTWGLLATLKGHTAYPSCLSFSPNGRRLASVAEDKTARLWSVASAQVELELRDGDHVPRSIAWSPDGKTIAVGNDDGTMSLWDADGKRRTTLTGLRNRILSLTFTPSSREILMTGTGYGENEAERGCSLIDLATGQERVRFKRHTNVVIHGNISADGKLAVSAGGNNHEAFVWRTSDGSLVQVLTSKARACHAVGWSPDGNSIAWGHINANGGATPLEQSFRLGELRSGGRPTAQFRGPELTHGNRTLELTANFEMAVKEGSRTVSTFRGSSSIDRVYCFTWLPDGQILVGTLFGVYVFDPETNKIIRSYIGPTAENIAIAAAPNGCFFLTASRDMTLRIWDVQRQEPLLSLFFAGPDWIAWTQEGIYATSPNGERIMGWQVNNEGPHGLSSYHAAAQFRKSLYDPEVIKRVVASGSVADALAQAGRNPAQALSVSQVLPPSVTLTSPTGLGTMKVEPRFEVRATAQIVGKQPVTGLRLLVNGRPYVGRSGVQTINDPAKGEVQAFWDVELPPGLYSLAAVAESTVSRSVSSPVEVRITGGNGDQRPALYILAVGIDDYPEPMRLKYAAADADAITQVFRDKAGRVFRQVETKVLKNKEATGKAIEQGFNWLAGKMTHQDVGIMFFSGHGLRLLTGTLYLIPADVDPKNIQRTCVPARALKVKLAEIPGRVVLMLDTCHSGAATDRLGGQRFSDDLVRDLVTEDYGIVVMSSSAGREFSLESQLVNQGLFTKAVVEGLSGQADVNRDGLVYLNELEAYAAWRVRNLSGGTQHPITAKPPTIRSFPLSQP